MEECVFISDISKADLVKGEYARLYYGVEFCEHLINNYHGPRIGAVTLLEVTTGKLGDVHRWQIPGHDIAILSEWALLRCRSFLPRNVVERIRVAFHRQM